MRIRPLWWPRKIFDALMEPRNGDSRSALFIFVLAAIGFTAATFVFAIAGQIYGAELGPFGDFFGGILNPIFSLLTFIGLLITIVMQQSEIRIARASADKQAFETLFFQMLTIHDSIVNSMDLRTLPALDGQVPEKQWHGRDCFPRFYEHFKQEIKRASENKSLNIIEDAYEAFWKRDRKDLGHYFRYLYNMIRVVDESNANTTQYMKLLRAQLSDYELVILFYNGLNARGAKFKPYIEKYAIFDNLDETLLLNIDDVNRYSDSARKDSVVVIGKPRFA